MAEVFATRSQRDSIGQNLLMIAFTVGLLLVLGASSLFAWQWQRTAGLSRTQGTVTGYRDGVPVVRYSVSGRTWHVDGPVRSKSPLQVGNVVTVYYPSHAPQQARFGSFALQWLLPILLGGVGLRFFSGALAIMQSTHAASPSPRRAASDVSGFRSLA
ncbi:hypothetical protein Mal4_34900 [Maioricimonas rarisocia]|uniref:DUF3592 domain-containing protein n=1 Tax=Maioricimonas rarisocia TaxID=2528026 RepID=A0A517Z9J0_9PLAN|nr:DUF3592 domain-containing protein [Maioricimonas rarisocia]QDU39154.1 hypothetical protein Mal4_34900 [Maioricimonas rarisocia]